jgi:hypothetical protein
VAIAPITSAWGAAGWGTSPWGGEVSFGGSSDQTVNPTAIASMQSMGTPYIVVPGIGPSHIPSQQAMGTPAIGGGTVTTDPATIPSPRAIGTPNVVGPIYPATVPSQQALGTPFIDAAQTLDPTAIGTMQFMGTPTLNFVENVAPTAIASQQFLGSPTITGGPSPMKPYAIASQQAFGIPAITGGSGQLSVSVGGVVWPNTGPTGVLAQGGSDTSAPTTYESSNPPTITSQTLGRWTLNVDLFDDTGNYTVAVGQTIVITEGGYTLFAGCVQTVAYQRMMNTEKAIIWHVTATDKSGICDRRIVPVITFPAGSDVAQTILTLVANNLNGEGIITTPQSVPTDGSLGTLSADLTLNYDTVTDAFNQLGTLSGTIWYVDPTGVLWFNSFNSLPAAPWGLEENGGDYRSLLVAPTNIDYANQVFAVSNLTTLPGSGSSGGGGGGGDGTGSTTETYVMTPGNINVLTLPDGTTIIGVATSLPIGTLYSIMVNGNPQTVVEITQWNGQEPSFGTSDFGPWFWTSNQTNVTLSVLSGAAFPISGATLVINYTPYTSNAQASIGEALTPVDPATGDPLGTCGSGVYQVAVQVQNVSSVDDLNAIAAAELVKRGGAQIQITFQTDKPGLLPGMLLNVNIPNLFLNNVTFLITYMQGIAAPAFLEFGSRFQWEVMAVTNQDPGNWAQWYANLLNNASNPLPVPNYEDADFVLAPGSSLAGGNVTTNPYIVKNTGKLLVMFAAAGIPPTDQDLSIFFFVNGTRIPGEVVISGGSAANTTVAYQFPTTNPLYVFNTATENDVITIGVSYTVTGANPTPASNVSATLRWTM